MGEIIDIEEFRSHLVVPTPDGNAHVLPKSLMEDLIEGRREIEDVDDWKMIIRTVIGEWLGDLGQ